MKPAGGTDEKLRFARSVVRELTPMLRGGHTKLQIDEILLDVVPEEPEVVVLFRNVEAPEHLYEFRRDTKTGGGDDAYIEATIIWANFLESTEGGGSSRITKTGW